VKPGFFSSGGPTICKVPSSPAEAMKSDLMNITQKMRCKGFYVYANNYDVNNSKTWEGDMDARKVTFE